ncbi:MAG: protein kinase, partial [Prosthecobacter sp.]|nr:protein kinase [Prosthecobacter sp.]
SRSPDSEFEVKIADFGATKPIDMMDESEEKVMSLCWSAPELFTSYATTASDVYALGMVFYELFLRELPFRHILSLDETVSKSAAFKEELCQHRNRPNMSAERMGLDASVAQPIMDLISSCWTHEAYLRPTAASVSSGLNQDPFSAFLCPLNPDVARILVGSSPTSSASPSIRYGDFSSGDYCFFSKFG